MLGTSSFDTFILQREYRNLLVIQTVVQIFRLGNTWQLQWFYRQAIGCYVFPDRSKYWIELRRGCKNCFCNCCISDPVRKLTIERGNKSNLCHSQKCHGDKVKKIVLFAVLTQILCSIKAADKLMLSNIMNCNITLCI